MGAFERPYCSAVQTSLLVLALLLGIAVGAGGMALLRDRHDADTATNDQREPSEPSGIAALLKKAGAV